MLERGFGGIKTGITKSAGACMSAWYSGYVSEQKTKISIIIIVLGCPDINQRFDDIVKVKEWCIQKYIERSKHELSHK